MNWYFRLLQKIGTSIIYLYSRDSEEYDGRMEYDTVTGDVRTVVPCKEDKGSKTMIRWSESHFYDLEDNGWPDVLHVCCG